MMASFRGIGNTFLRFSSLNPYLLSSQLIFCRGIASTLFVKGGKKEMNSSSLDEDLFIFQKTDSRLEFQFQTEVELPFPHLFPSDKNYWHQTYKDRFSSIGISFSTTEKTLAEAFSQFGEVVEAKIIMDKRKLRPKGFAYVTFTREDEAEKALTEMNGKVVDGRTVLVDYAM
ncbi:Small RNA-binding protein 11, chloroplastic [Vitis vinifera]|uniref:Small RNA-binding protein 11, chloroplastic n=1 Tax=Vitis vinifera TaxID=29760 RepID=A0A438DD09_VITVI|nr:Small RNA-binding protein 11, chloroplastic [Vitis vinifera]